MNILITGGKNAKVFKLLKAFEHDFVIFGDYDDVPAISNASYRFASLGKKNEESIAHILLNFCLSEAIDMVIPTCNFEIEQMAKAALLFDEYAIEVLLPDMGRLHDYVQEDTINNASFVVLKNGELLFSSVENLRSDFPPHLSGAFELEAMTGKMRLFLV